MDTTAQTTGRMPERPAWCEPARWREYLWSVAGRDTTVRLRKACEYGLPVIPENQLA